MEIKRVVMLANSRKHAGRCLAGREKVGQAYGGWIRPISDRASEEVSEYERHYEDGTDPQVLDVVDLPLIQAKPHSCQTENWLISPSHYWVKAGSLNWNEARVLAETPQTLWTNGSSTYHGQNDEIELSVAQRLTTSICLIHVNSVEIRVIVPGAAFNDPKRRVQAKFTFNGISYAIWVTDPVVTRKYLATGAPSVEALGESLITVSLAEPFRKSSGEITQNKLAAAIITR